MSFTLGPIPITPFFTLTLPSRGERVSSSDSSGVGVQCGAEISHHTNENPPFFTFKCLITTRRQTLFLLKNILYIYMYICVCMYGHMYVYAHVHVYMYISTSSINISCESCKYSLSYVCLPHGIISSVLC